MFLPSFSVSVSVPDNSNISLLVIGLPDSMPRIQTFYFSREPFIEKRSPDTGIVTCEKLIALALKVA